jgi:hypothetical protein
MFGIKTAAKTMIGLVITTSLSTSAALAQATRTDVFNRNTWDQQPQQQRPTGYQKSPTEIWFDQFDRAIVEHLPTPDEKMKLSRTFGDPPQLERVVVWTNTAASVAKRYRDLAQNLKSMPLAASLTSDPMSSMLITYKQSLADWYDDSASLLEDYIKPRPPARTREELEEQLGKMTERSQQLKDSMQHLVEMDSKIRDHFHVHSRDDALWAFVKKPLPTNP